MSNILVTVAKHDTFSIGAHVNFVVYYDYAKVDLDNNNTQEQEL